jgi:hypothetical protein
MRSLFRQVFLPFHSELREYANDVAFHTEKRPQVRVVACDHQPAAVQSTFGGLQPGSLLMAEAE